MKIATRCRRRTSCAAPTAASSSGKRGCATSCPFTDTPSRGHHFYHCDSAGAWRSVRAVELPGYRFEPLVLALVALAALPVVNLTGPQDRTRYELTRHLVLHHSLTVEPGLFDRAVYGG